MILDGIERWVRWIGGAAAFAALCIVLFGLVRALFRPRGRTTGKADTVLRAHVYLVITILYFGAWYLLWRPIPLTLSPAGRVISLATGALLCFPGLAFVVWGRLTLGKMYNVSSALGAQLYADHRLITSGPFALVRHPMYAGIITASFGGFFIYRTWTLVFAAVTFLGLAVRAGNEEKVLAAEFGEQWEEYQRKVPGWFPRFRRNRMKP